MNTANIDKISTLRIITVLVICGIFSIIFINFSKYAIPLSLLTLIIVILWVNTAEIDLKLLISICLFIYPLLPRFWGIRISEGIPALHAHRLLSLVIIIFLIRKKSLISYYRDFLRANIFTKPIMLIMISMTLTAIVTDDKSGTINFLLSFICETVLIPVVIFSTYKTRDDIEKLIPLLIYSAVILAIFGLFENSTEYNFYSLFGAYDASFGDLSAIMRGGRIRITGPFDHPIAYGAYFTLIMPFVLYKFKDRIFPQLILLLLFFSVITYTDSRAAQLGFGIIFLTYLIFISGHKTIFFSLSPVALLSGSFRYRLMTLNPFFSGDPVLQGSADARMGQFEYLKGFIYKNLLLGYGQIPPPAKMRWISGTGNINYNNTVDSFYLLYTWFYGLCGLFSWLVLLTLSIVKPILVFRKKILQDDLLLLILSGLAAFCLINLVVALYSFHFVFWIYLGILTRLMYNFQHNENTKNG